MDRPELRETKRLWFCSVLILLPLLAPSLGLDLDPKLLSKVNIFPGGASRVTVSGNYGYVSSGRKLMIFDFSDPAAPKQMAEYSATDTVERVLIAGDLAYVAARTAGVLILNISDPASPKLAGSYDTPGSAYSAALMGKYLFVADHLPGIQVLDCSDPMNPVRVGGCDLPGGARDLAIVGDYLYVAVRTEPVQIVDIASPTQPKAVATLSEYSSRIVVSGKYACLCLANGFVLYDLSGRLGPRLVGISQTGYEVRDAVFHLDRLFIVSNSPGLEVVDIRDTFNPKVVGGALSEVPSGVQIFGEVVCVTDSRGLQLLDWSRTANPQRGATSPTWTVYLAEAAATLDGLLLVAEGPFLRILDRTDPFILTELARYECGASISGVATFDHYALVCARSAGVEIFDLSQPKLPRKVGGHPSSYARAAKIVGKRAYVADENEGLIILDLNDPADPKKMGGFDTSGFLSNVAVSGNYAYLADGTNGLVVLEVSNPAQPRSVGSYRSSSSSYGVALRGNFAWLMGSSGTEILNVTDPTAPSPLQGSFTGKAAYRTEFVGDLAYVATTGGLEVFNVVDPYNPVRVGGNFSAMAYDMAIADGFIYLASWADGVQVLHSYTEPGFKAVAATENGMSRLTISGPPQVPFSLLRSTDLENWSQIKSGTFVMGAMEISDDTLLEENAAFYKLRLE